MKLSKTAIHLALSALAAPAVAAKLEERIDTTIIADIQTMACTTDGHLIVHFSSGGLEVINAPKDSALNVIDAIGTFKRSLQRGFNNLATGMNYKTDLKPFTNMLPPKLQMFNEKEITSLTTKLEKAINTAFSNNGTFYGYSGLDTGSYAWTDQPDPYCIELNAAPTS